MIMELKAGEQILDVDSHDTILLGWTESGELGFCKSYEYSKHSGDAQRDLAHVTDNYRYWHFGSASSILKLSKFKDEEE